MTLIAIIVALIAERLLGHVPGWGTPRLLRGYVATMRRVLPLSLALGTWAVLIQAGRLIF